MRMKTMMSGMAAAFLLAAGTVLPAAEAGKPWPEFRLRGIDTAICVPTESGFLDEAFFRRLAEWNVNVVRVAFSVDRKSPWDVKAGDPVPPVPADNPMLPYRKNLEGLEQVVRVAKKYNIYVVPALFNVVGRQGDFMLRFKDGDEGYYANVAPVWEHLARRYRNEKQVLAYDILNEPNGHHARVWRDRFAQETVDRIRAVDPDTWIIYEPPPWSLPDQAFEEIEPLAGDRLVYSFHFYYPHSYTHQGIGGYRKPEFRRPYPGMLRNFSDNKPQLWDKAMLEKSMRNVIEFRKKHGVKIFVGEFGVIRWAEGSDRWLKDAIELFEANGWDWTFHSYYEWNGWNPTCSADDPPAGTGDGGRNTPMLLVLTGYWKQNHSRD